MTARTVVLQDLAYGARTLSKTPAFTAVAIVTLALGIGASTAIFSVTNAVLLRSLPYSHSDRLILISRDHRKSNTLIVAPFCLAPSATRPGSPVRHSFS